ncbi:hypothetical protein [Desulfonatronovibrio magnus]|uniref:hypothetical protein n=1 Tax=Desulfonatronovibrio magnus TaxID=698827 RepID=UPI0012F71A57|nr:hypothetical protein [Desulfonatronovibrio magnus]
MKHLRLILMPIILGLSTIIYLMHTRYMLFSSRIQENEIIISTHWTPLLIHSGATLLIMVLFFVYFNNIISYLRNTYAKILDQITHMRTCDSSILAVYSPWFLKSILTVFIVLAMALIQTYTIWDYFGVRVDEKALFMYSIGFFGGDYNPNWFGYGSLGMYILYIAYMLLAIFPILGGYFASLDEYAMQVFYNGYFVLVARYVFSVLGIAAVFLYAQTARKCSVPVWLILLFLLVCFFSPDNVYYANYLRSDYLVGFFVAMAVFCGIQSNRKIYMYLMAIAVAGAICSKISALPIFLFLIAYCVYRKYDKTISWTHLAGIILTFILFLNLFQPYAQWMEFIKAIFFMGTEGDIARFNWGKTYVHSVPERLMAIAAIFKSSCGLPVLLSLFFIFFTWRFIHAVIPGLFMLSLLTLPYLISSEITFYWFAPAFNLVRFLALLSIAGFMSLLFELINSIPNYYYTQIKNILKSITVAGTIALSVYVLILPGFNQYVNIYKWEETNKDMAQKWIEKNLIESGYIALEGESMYNHFTPKVYDPENIQESKRVSRYFMYNRSQNQYLNYLFETYLEDYYLNNIGVKQVKGVRRHLHIPEHWRETGYYYVTSPAIYNRFLSRDPSSIPEHLREELKKNIDHFDKLISCPLIKAFRSGRGPDIEIYYISYECY